MSIYGTYLQENVKLNVVYEFNFKDTIENIKKSIKNAILALINRIDKFLNKCKDSKIKSVCKTIISKLKSLLTKTDSVKNQEEAKKVSDDLNKCSKEFNNNMNGISDEVAKAVDEKRILTLKIFVKDHLIMDPTGKESDNIIRYASSKDVNIFDDSGNDIEIPESEWNKDNLNYKLVEIVNNFTKENYSFLKKFVRFIYKDRI